MSHFGKSRTSRHQRHLFSPCPQHHFPYQRMISSFSSKRTGRVVDGIMEERLWFNSPIIRGRYQKLLQRREAGREAAALVQDIGMNTGTRTLGREVVAEAGIDMIVTNIVGKKEIIITEA
ncbi:hypothetical protein Q3G72_015177 [Acer saccharum]|nr:hypothetical protein Q3G72_015177 [Acer saccharum]